MTTQSRRLGVLAFAKQASLGTPAAAPTFAVPIISGGLRPMPENAELPLTSDTLAEHGDYRQRVRGGGTVTILAHPEAIGLLLYHAMGAQAVSGAGPYTHTFTLADALPVDEPITLWSLVGDDWIRFSDAFLGRLVLRGSSGQNVMVELGDVVAFDYDDVAAPAYTLTEPEPRFKYLGSTTLLEADNATPVAVENMEAAELTIDRGLELRYAASLTPTSITPARRVAFLASLVWDGDYQGWDFFRASAYGTTATGGGPSQSLPAGSFDVTFARHPASAPRALRLFSPEDNWQYQVERPDADPAGGPIEFDAGGKVIRPSGGGTEVTVELINDTAGAY